MSEDAASYGGKPTDPLVFDGSVIVPHGWNDSEVVATCSKHHGQHLARGVYISGPLNPDYIVRMVQRTLAVKCGGTVPAFVHAPSEWIPLLRQVKDREAASLVPRPAATPSPTPRTNTRARASKIGPRRRRG